MANRIDNGFNIEVRAEPLNLDEDGDKGNTDHQTINEHICTIESSSKTLTYLKAEGKPILSLEESNDSEEKEKPKKKDEAPKK